MSTGRAISRKDFLHGIFHPSSRNGDSPSAPRSETQTGAPEPDYLSMLPPEFSGVMLDMEAARLGGDPAHMTRNEMAALVVQAMYGNAAPAAQGKKTPGSAQEEERTPLD